MIKFATSTLAFTSLLVTGQTVSDAVDDSSKSSYAIDERIDVSVIGTGATNSSPGWLLNAKFSMQQIGEAANKTEELRLYTTLTVSSEKNAAGEYEKLPTNSFLQTYVQFYDEATTTSIGSGSGLFYENYTSSIRYVEFDTSTVKSTRYFDEASCGTEVLGKMTGVTYNKIHAPETSCGFYLPHYTNMSVKDDENEGVSYTIAFSRGFTDEVKLEDFKRGQAIKMIAGYNIFETANDTTAKYAGYSNQFEITFSTEVAIDGALSGLSSGISGAMAMAVIYLTF